MVRLFLKIIAILGITGIFSFSSGATMTHEGPVGVGGFWVFTPDHLPKNPMPVVFFFPGWSASNTINYGNFFEHMTEQNTVVVYIPYMNSIATPFLTFEKNAAKGMNEALQWLRDQAIVDESKIMYAGHSAGAILALSMAARQNLVPLTPAMVLSMEPGKLFINDRRQKGRLVPAKHVADIPASTNLVLVQGDQTGYFNDRGMAAQTLYDMATNTPDSKKIICVIESVDETQVANHFFPSAANPAYDNGTPVGYHLRRSDRVDVEKTRFVKQRANKLNNAPTNDLDLKLWAIFDQALARVNDDALDAKEICGQD
jgi:hypothetical protein